MTGNRIEMSGIENPAFPANFTGFALMSRYDHPAA
jgi:hypothetical protein